MLRHVPNAAHERVVVDNELRFSDTRKFPLTISYRSQQVLIFARGKSRREDARCQGLRSLTSKSSTRRSMRSAAMTRAASRWAGWTWIARPPHRQNRYACMSGTRGSNKSKRILFPDARIIFSN